MLNIKELKKTDLHCHLDGSLSATTLSHFLHRTPDFSELSVDDSCTSLTEYFKEIRSPAALSSDKSELRTGCIHILKRTCRRPDEIHRSSVCPYTLHAGWSLL